MHLYPSSPYKEQTCSTYFYTNLQIWHTMNKIRLLTKDELPKAIELSWQVFTITSKEDFNDEGLEFFKSFIYNEKYIDEIKDMRFDLNYSAGVKRKASEIIIFSNNNMIPSKECLEKNNVCINLR